MRCRSLMSCLVVSIGVFLVVGGMASAAVDIGLTYSLSGDNNATNKINLHAYGHGKASHKVFGITVTVYDSDMDVNQDTHAHGTIPAHMTMNFDPASKAAIPTNISFDYSNPGTISIDDASVFMNLFLGLGETVATNGLKATFYTPDGIGPVSGTSIPFENHWMEVNRGTMNASGFYPYSMDFTATPKQTQGVGSGSLTVTTSASHFLGIDSTGYHVSCDYTSQLTIPFDISEIIDQSGSSSGFDYVISGRHNPSSEHAMVQVSGTIITSSSTTFSHMFDYLRGDANLSGRTDVADLTLLLNNYNASGKAWADGDFTGDGIVNVADLTVLLNDYNKSPPASVQTSDFAAAVPEPGTVVMLLSLVLSMAGFGLWKRSR
jgi:hypothetical protein